MVRPASQRINSVAANEKPIGLQAVVKGAGKKLTERRVAAPHACGRDQRQRFLKGDKK